MAQKLISAQVQGPNNHGLRIDGFSNRLVRPKLFLLVWQFRFVQEKELCSVKSDTSSASLVDQANILRKLDVCRENNLRAVGGDTRSIPQDSQLFFDLLETYLQLSVLP